MALSASLTNLFPELYSQIIITSLQHEKIHVYRALLCIPKFAKTLTIGKILDWMEECGVDVRVIPETELNIFTHGWDFNATKKHRLPVLVWKMNGEFHRVNGPTFERNSDKFWYYYNKLHRIGGPAYISDSLIWFNHGVRHREDGPGIINDFRKCVTWTLEDKGVLKVYVTEKYNADNATNALLSKSQLIEWDIALLRYRQNSTNYSLLCKKINELELLPKQKTCRISAAMRPFDI